MKFNIGYLLGFAAVILAITAAFFSVTGLGQLFAGASMAVIIMASALELSKIITATFLHKYWSEISKLLRIYLTMGVIVLVGITSGGIYGFLSNAYQKTSTELDIFDNEILLVDNKMKIFEDKISSNEEIINSKNKRYDNLLELRSIQETRLDSMINRRYFSNANQTREEIKNASEKMSGLQNDVEDLTIINNNLNDSIVKYDTRKLEMKTQSTISGEVGPLKYISEITDTPMDTVVNYLILLLIFVFDPLAICLVVATSWVFERNKKNDDESKREEDDDDIILDVDDEPSKEEREIKRPYSHTKKTNRGFSNDIPEPKSMDKRIGTNKYLKNERDMIYKKKR